MLIRAVRTTLHGRILRKVDHPKAKEWLEKLNRQHPPKKPATWKIFTLLFGLLIIAYFLAWLWVDNAAVDRANAIAFRCSERAEEIALNAEQYSTLNEKCRVESGYYEIERPPLLPIG